MKPKYRKSHYRGQITPFWERYKYTQEEKEDRLLEFEVGLGFASGLLPRDLETEILQEYCRHSGRKTLPKPNRIYPTSRYTSRRR